MVLNEVTFNDKNDGKNVTNEWMNVHSVVTLGKVTRKTRNGKGKGFVMRESSTHQIKVPDTFLLVDSGTKTAKED